MMKVFAIIPVKKFENGKSRLSSFLDADERIHLSGLMLDDTLSALGGAKSLQYNNIVVVSGDRRAEAIATKRGVMFLREERERGVNSAVELADRYCTDQGADATLVVPQDLPLLEPYDIDMVCDIAESEKSCIVICPSLRYDGTNLLLRKPPCAIKTYYDNDSYEAHINSANKSGVPVKLYFSRKLMVDIDTPEDVAQLAKEVSEGSSKTLEFIRSRIARL